MSDRKPACIKVIEHQSQTGWEAATQWHVDRLDTCNLCFPDDNIDRVDEDQLLIARKDPQKIHREQGTGEIDHSSLASRRQSDLHHRLADPDFGPEDLGLPVGGERA